MKKKESINHVNKKITFEKNLHSRSEAIARAREYLKEKGYDASRIEGFVYLVGPTVSDLIIISPAIKNKVPSARPSTDSEWDKYFRTFIL